MNLRRIFPPSIVSRLTLLLGLIAFAVFVVSGTWLSWSLNQQLKAAEAEDIEAKIILIKHLVEGPRGPPTLGALRTHLDDALIGYPGVSLWLFGEQGAVLYGDKRVSGKISGIAGPVEFFTPEGAPLRGVRFNLNLSGESPLPIAEAVVAIDTRPRRAQARRYNTGVLTVCSLGVLSVVLLAAWATKTSLRPLERVSREARTISPTALGRRLSETGVDDEVVALVQALNRALDRLEGSYKHLESFNAHVAHELKTPLATMISGTQLALQSQHSPDELREIIGSNLEEMESLRVLVNDMLFLAKADQGAQPPEPKPASLAELSKATVHYYEIALHDAALRGEVVGDAWTVCDPGLIKRAVANLLSNAVRYARPGTQVQIDIHHDDTKAYIEVSNVGEPLQRDELGRMFERFHKQNSLHSESNGLGLSIVQAIAKMHGGEGFARSEPDRNTFGFSMALGDKRLT